MTSTLLEHLLCANHKDSFFLLLSCSLSLEDTDLPCLYSHSELLQQLFPVPTGLLSSFVEVESIKRHFKSRLVGTVLNGYLCLRKLVVQRTKLIDETQDMLLEMLEDMTTGSTARALEPKAPMSLLGLPGHISLISLSSAEQRRGANMSMHSSREGGETSLKRRLVLGVVKFQSWAQSSRKRPKLLKLVSFIGYRKSLAIIPCSWELHSLCHPYFFTSLS